MAPSSVEHSGRIARVVPLLRLHHLGDRRFDYLIPEPLAAEVTAGLHRHGAFRQADRAGRGAWRRRSAAEVPAEGLRAVAGVAPDGVSGDLLDLAQALATRYLCSLESCLRLVAPVGSASGRSTAGDHPQGPRRGSAGSRSCHRCEAHAPSSGRCWTPSRPEVSRRRASASRPAWAGACSTRWRGRGSSSPGRRWPRMESRHPATPGGRRRRRSRGECAGGLSRHSGRSRSRR